MSNTIETTELEDVNGGAAGVDGSGAPNPAGLALDENGAPIENKANNHLARVWNFNNGIGPGKGGHYTKDDGQFPSLYKYEYANGSRFAPGADD
jgi:hypothetical protein